jgi:hypothetical protein
MDFSWIKIDHVSLGSAVFGLSMIIGDLCWYLSLILLPSWPCETYYILLNWNLCFQNRSWLTHNMVLPGLSVNIVF